MTGKLIKTTALFTLLFLLLTGCGVWYAAQKEEDASYADAIVSLNEIEQLTKAENKESTAKKEIAGLKAMLRQGTQASSTQRIHTSLVIFFLLFVCYTLLLLTYIYLRILKPFQKMEVYAQQIANGNLDIPLTYERTNFFGSFTWAFDHMRTEIQYARKSEAKAIENNKTIIAGLSHDIKTPIASIRAYAEGLEANLDTSYEKRERYLRVILDKCDEVTRLTNDLMLHSLSELNSLDIKSEVIDIQTALKRIIHDLEYPGMVLREPLPPGEVITDPSRLAQIIENLLSNARKYAADCEIHIFASTCEEYYELHIYDHGNGIPAQDMPFVFQKFYQGKNASRQSGSGLGLYIVKHIAERMRSDVRLINHADGLEAIVSLPLYKC